MSSNKERYYFAVAGDDGHVTLLMFFNKNLDPTRSVLEQYQNASFIDTMPIVEAMELGSGLVTGAAMATRKYADRVRHATIRRKVEQEVNVPANKEELARLSAYLEGVNLDPAAELPVIQDLLRENDPDEVSPPQEG